MTPITQTILGPIYGDCYRACLASILEIPILSLPADLGWMRELAPGDYREFLRRFDFDFAAIEWRRPQDFPNPWPGPRGTWHFLGGLSPREGLHATVARDGVMVHDPHPTRRGLLPGPGDADILLPLTPHAAEVLRRPMR